MHETYLYHISRKDHRHNFSLYFYPLYLFTTPQTSASSLAHTLLRPLGSFLPQFGLVLILGSLLIRKSLSLAIFGQTFAFVMLNKVCTSQYFMWYLFLLPLVLTESRLVTKAKWRTGLTCLVLWVASQVILFFLKWS